MARIRERDLVIPALKAAASNGGTISMSELIDEMIAEFDPSGEDSEIREGRRDSKFSQKVRNLVSHREVSSSMFSRGYATYHKDIESREITDSGRAFLAQVPDA